MSSEYLDYFGNWTKVLPENKLQEALSLVTKDMEHFKICPKQENVFRAFLECSYNNLKVVMVGMDPYPQKDVATGILFANSSSTSPQDYSPSLKILINSIDKYYDDIPCGEFSPELTYLCKQGILMINSALTVRMNQIGSHTLIWRSFLGDLLRNISIDKPNVIFVLFGSQAQSFESYIKSSKIVKCMHPAYCARKEELLPDIFSEVDKYLIEIGETPIYWK